MIPVLVVFLAVFATPARGQFVVRSWLPWRTIDTRHFEFHYPVPLEAWTRSVAARADAIDSAVAAFVGYAPSERTHVVVDNPYATANGSAWPFLNRPAINLWAEPPEPRDDIGEFRDWGEMLVSHEFGHIAHLTRPSRSRRFNTLWDLLPVDLGPIALRAPRWVTEGYATFIEGRVTGSGRPHGVWRPALLRQLALEGQLPRYENLNASGAFEGGSFAYLAGSAFLEWLADRSGDSSLVFVWRRMSARQNRSFDESFRGVFGESPATLYGRFTAEMTGKALAAGARLPAGADTGRIEQRLAWSTGDPAISPDGRQMAIVLRSPIAPTRLVVWGTAEEPDTGRARRDSILLAHDPEDVPAKPLYPPAKRVLASLRARAGSPYQSPRFLRDGRIVVTRNTARGDGSYAPDLYVWDPRRSTVHRVTHGAGITHADPLPDGRSAAATRCVSGWCELVVVSLDDGTVRVVEAGGPDESYYRPRVSPDGKRAAVTVHTRAGWRVVLTDLTTGARTGVAGLDNVDAYDAAWINGTTIVATADATGAPQIERVELATGARVQLTGSTGAAVAPEPNRADGSVWFLSLHARGYDLRRTVATGVEVQPRAEASLTPATAVPTTRDVNFAADSPTPPRPFGLAPRIFVWIPVPRADADGLSAGVALTSRDLIGRSALTVQGALGEPTQWHGGSATAEWLGSRPSIRVDAFGATQRSASIDGVPRFDTRLAGGQAMIDGARSYDAWAGRLRLGGSVADVRSSDADRGGLAAVSTTRWLAFTDLSAGLLQRGEATTFSESFSARGAAGRSFDQAFQRFVGSASLALAGRGVPPLSASATYGRTNAGAPPFEQLALGGGPVPLVPSQALSQRLPMPALPSAISVGTSAFTYRASLDARPLAFYWWGGSASDSGARFTRWQRVVGVEWTESVGSIPMAGTPGARAQIGFAESVDDPVRHRLRAYVSLVLDP